MRKVLFVLFLMPSCLFAQNYTENVDVPGKNSATLYKMAKEWFTESFTAKDDLPPVEDNAHGKLSGKENSTFMVYSSDVAVNMSLSYNIKVTVKDGQYKYEIDNIMVGNGKKFPISTFREGSTREGTIQMFKTAGMKTPTKKMIESSIDYSVKVATQVDTELKRVIDSLSDKMKN